jgi:predicted dehydrogenase
LDVGSHGLDRLDFYFGPIDEVAGFASNQAGTYEVEDMVSGAWRFRSGIHGTGAWCFAADRDEDRITVYGDKGTLSLSVLDAAGPVEIAGEGKTESLLFATPEHVQQPLIQMVVDELLGTGTCPSTGESALRTDRALETLRQCCTS